MKELAVAIVIACAFFAIAWGVRGCPAKQVQIEQEKTRQMELQLQWKRDSLKQQKAL